jgi:hypothetical protein
MTCPHYVGFDKFLNPPSNSNLLEKILMIVNNLQEYKLAAANQVFIFGF